MRYRFEGLIFGGAYTWRGSFFRFGARGAYLKRDAYSVLLALRGGAMRRSRYVSLTSWQNLLILTNRGPANMAEKKQKIDMHNFPVRGHSHFLNSSPGVSSKLLHFSKRIDRALGVMGRFYHFQPSCFPYIKLITLQSGRS